MNVCTCGIPTTLDRGLSILRIVVSSIFSVLLVGAGLAWFVHPAFHSQVLQFFVQKALIVNGASSVAFEFWSEVPKTVEITFSAYLFNVTNPEAVKTGAKPDLQEVGPFVYTVITRKTHINFLNNFHEASYYNNITLIFNEKLTKQKNSKTTLNTNITVPNLPLIVIDQLLDGSPKIKPWVSPVLSMLNEKEIFIQKSVNETLWGYKDPALDALSKKSFITHFTGPIDPMIGLLRGQNNSIAPGLITVNLGTDDYHQAQKIVTINGTNKLTWWDSDYANAITGSDGQQQHPMISKKENLTSYSTDFRRSFWMTYDHDRHLHGVNLYRYKMAKETLQTAENYPPNLGFCVGGRCPPYDGLLNISSTMPMNVPIFIGQPHFYKADPHYLYNVTGLEPNQTRHESYSDMEPVTGFVMALARRMQYNVYLKRSNLVASMKNIPPATFQPIIWYEVHAEMGTFDAIKWKSTIGLLKFIYDYGIAMLFVTGIAIAISMIIRTVLRRQDWDRQQECERDDEEPLMGESARLDVDNNELRRNSEMNGELLHGQDDDDLDPT